MRYKLTRTVSRFGHLQCGKPSYIILGRKKFSSATGHNTISSRVTLRYYESPGKSFRKWNTEVTFNWILLLSKCCIPLAWHFAATDQDETSTEASMSWETHLLNFATYSDCFLCGPIQMSKVFITPCCPPHIIRISLWSSRHVYIKISPLISQD
jgi:hypothetical protein